MIPDPSAVRLAVTAALRLARHRPVRVARRLVVRVAVVVLAGGLLYAPPAGAVGADGTGRLVGTSGLSAVPLAAVPAPGGSTAPPGVDVKFNTILSWASWVAFGICVLGVIGSGAAMAVSHRRGQSGEHAAGIGYALAGAVAIAAASLLINFVAN